MQPKQPKSPRGRPANPMPERIPDTPENVAKACMQGPPKKDWDYLREHGGKNRKDGQ